MTDHAEEIELITGATGPLKIFIVTGEPSGDALGGALMSALRKISERSIEFFGVGGARMAEQGFQSQFPMSELSLMGIAEIVPRLPRILGLANKTISKIVAQQPDILIIIDSPEFTHNVARRVRKRAPQIAIVNYVSPTVWAWRSGRAKRMRRYIDRVLAIFPFEVAVHQQLAGPPCVYVGHPLIERIAEFCGKQSGRLEVSNPPRLLIMPGSRRSEIRRLMQPFGDALALAQEEIPDLEVVIPVVPAVRSMVEDQIKNWKIQPKLVHTQEEKIAVFRSATAAIVASGTATLELSLARVPMIAGYKVEWLVYKLSWMLKAHSVLLPNLIAGRNFVPEFIQDDCNPSQLAEAVIPLLRAGKRRQDQLDGFRVVTKKLALDGDTPSVRAAREILDVIVSR